MSIIGIWTGKKFNANIMPPHRPKCWLLSIFILDNASCVYLHDINIFLDIEVPLNK